MSIYDKASLVLIPSGTKTSKVYSQKPVSGDGDFTFSRSTAATRVNSSGNIEKETQNLLLQSNSFDTTWLNQLGTGTITGGQAGYDGTNDAWLISKDTSTFRSVRQVVSWSGVSTFSVYAKVGSLSDAALRLDTGAGAIQILYDLTNGSVTSTGGIFIDAGSDNIGGGWYRLYVSANVSSGTNVHIYVDRNGTTAGNILIQDAQLEQGLVARDVITTTTTAVEGGITDNVPRLDYSGGATCPSLLLEPQRSNLVPYSEHLESSDWAKTRCTIEDNSTTSPEGVVNASKMTSTDASESYIQDNLTTTGTKITWSFFAKKGDLDYAHGLVWDLSANGCRQWFNLSTGAVGGTTTFGSGYSVDSATIEDYGNGWYRCAMVVNSTAGTQGCRVNISSADTTIGSAVNSYGYFYGIQLEDASYETSYIPTFGSSVTRNGDNYLLDNMATNGITNDSAISFFIDAEAAVDTANTFIDLFALKLSNGENFRIESRTNDRFYVQCSSGFVNSGDSPNSYNTASFAPSAGRAKILFTMTSAQLKLYYNGSLLETFDGSYNINFNQFRSDVSNATAQLKNNINQALILTSAISNQEAIDLTTI